MSGIAPSILFNANIVHVTFVDEIGNRKSIQGTGFWIRKEFEGNYFITNAHNLNPAMKLGAQTTFKLESIKVELRTTIGEMLFDTTHLYEFDLQHSQVKFHKNADVACIKNEVFKESMGNHAYSCFEIAHLADEQFFCDHLYAMDVASFIGFPGKPNVPWYDDYWKLAVARTINIASFPRWEFRNKGIPTRDALLVSGLSFSGSSGSPVLSHEKGVRLIHGGTGSYIPPRLIGIMSGHWWNEERSDDAFRHSGLSYLTRSTSILELIS